MFFILDVKNADFSVILLTLKSDFQLICNKLRSFSWEKVGKPGFLGIYVALPYCTNSRIKCFSVC
ncbi:hypothetical protein HDF26_003601 [Pedobacter cryoconitis]|nr:hypothetical protein [Pedobacter cryoconitis]